MATGGAWQSETFDNGRDFEKVRAPQHVTQAPPMGSATPPTMYNPSPVGMGKVSNAFGVITLCLRIGQIVFTLLAFSIMGATKQKNIDYYDYYSYYSTVRFTAVKAFIGVLAVNCIVFLYAVVQLVQCFVNISRKGSFVSSPTTGFAMLTFIFDTVLAYALIAASAAGADSAVLLGNTSSNFSQTANASVAMSFFAFFLLALSAALWPVRLLKLTKSL